MPLPRVRAMPPKSYVSTTGKSYSLGKHIASGGEGDVYDVGSGMVAKIYKSPNSVRDGKIKAMLKIAIPPEIDSQVTWPKDALLDSHGNVAGFVMGKLDSKYLFEYFTEYPRMELHPQPDGYKTFYVLAKNLAFVVWKLHDAGVVIGDFNGKNIGFSEKGEPVIYDADSFHFPPKYKCTVGWPEYVPAWMRAAFKKGLGKYSGDTFSKESDDWVLATHIFELLMNGTHPYSSAPMGTRDAMTLSEAIEKGDCVFFKGVPGYRPPPYAPSTKILPPEIADLFRKAFTGHKRDVPSAREWYDALEKVVCDGFHPLCTEKHHNIPVSAHTVNCPLCNAYNSVKNAGVNAKPATKTKNKSVSKQVSKSKSTAPYATYVKPSQPVANNPTVPYATYVKSSQPVVKDHGVAIDLLAMVAIGLIIAACVTEYLAHDLRIFWMVVAIIGPGLTAIYLAAADCCTEANVIAFAGIIIRGCMILFGKGSVSSNVCCIAACIAIIALAVNFKST